MLVFMPEPKPTNQHHDTNCLHMCCAPLQSLSDDLAIAKDQAQETKNDMLHRQNVAQGRDKYKTLKQIRQGNTKHRVDMFEAM